MPTFNRKDIIEAHNQLEIDYNNGGWLHERPSNRRRMEATHVQLHRMGITFEKYWRNWKGYESLTENGKAIYHELRKRYGFDKWDRWCFENGVWIDRN